MAEAARQAVKNTENWLNSWLLMAAWSRLVTSTASYRMGSEFGPTRSRALCAHQPHFATVEFGFPSTVAHRQSGTRWDVETRRKDHLLRSAVTRGSNSQLPQRPDAPAESVSSAPSSASSRSRLSTAAHQPSTRAQVIDQACSAWPLRLLHLPTLLSLLLAVHRPVDQQSQLPLAIRGSLCWIPRSRASRSPANPLRLARLVRRSGRYPLGRASAAHRGASDSATPEVHLLEVRRQRDFIHDGVYCGNGYPPAFGPKLRGPQRTRQTGTVSFTRTKAFLPNLTTKLVYRLTAPLLRRIPIVCSQNPKATTSRLKESRVERTGRTEDLRLET